MEPPASILDDILTKFVLTAPDALTQDIAQLMFYVEQGHWYYEDRVRQQYPNLRSYKKVKDFAKLLFTNCDLLAHYSDDVDSILERFRSVKQSIPVMGAILLDESLEKVLLVKGFDSVSSWSFPRGKINKDEEHHECAAREVFEETGFDISKLININDYLEDTIERKHIKLFIVPGLDANQVQFQPQNAGEIGGYAWHPVSVLPTSSQESNMPYVAPDGTRHKFYAVWQFMKPLKEWIKAYRIRIAQSSKVTKSNAQAVFERHDSKIDNLRLPRTKDDLHIVDASNRQAAAPAPLPLPSQPPLRNPPTSHLYIQEQVLYKAETQSIQAAVPAPLPLHPQSASRKTSTSFQYSYGKEALHKAGIQILPASVPPVLPVRPQPVPGKPLPSLTPSYTKEQLVPKAGALKHKKSVSGAVFTFDSEAIMKLLL